MSKSTVTDSNNITISKSKLTDARLVAFGIIGMIALFAILLLIVSGGGVRHVPITFKEIIQTTVAFRNIDGETKLVGITGNSQQNPTLVSRTGTDTAYVLTVINQDNDLHMIYIDGFNLHTRILKSEDNDTTTIYTRREDVSGYYDRLAIDAERGTEASSINPLGQFMMVKAAGD